MQNPQTSRVASFPAELLSEIFAELQFKGRLYTSHTCRHWRASSLSSRAKLWTCIASYGRVPGALLAQLERAGRLPVSVYVSFHGRAPGMVCQTARAINQHLYHTRFLVVDGSNHFTDLTCADVIGIFKSFRSPAPMLEEFELAIFCGHPDVDVGDSSEDAMSESDSGDVAGGERSHLLMGGTASYAHREPDDNRNTDAAIHPVLSRGISSSSPNDFEARVTPGFTIPPNLFAGEAPRLWRVFINGDIEISRPRCAAFSGVRQLAWEPTDNVYEYDIEAIGRSFSRLERLEISYEAWSARTGEGYDLVSPLHLKQLYLRVEAQVADTSPLWLLQHLQFERIPDVRCFFDDYIEDWFPGFFVDGGNTDYSLTMARFLARRDDYDAYWRIEDLGVRPGRRILGIDNVWLGELPDPALWGNVVRLVIYEHFVADFADYLAPLPRVTQLQLIYNVPTRADEDGRTGLEDNLSVLSYPWAIQAPIPCPKLRTFELRPLLTRSHSLPVLLAPEDVYDFMRLCLAYSARKLDELIVWDAELLTHALGRLWLLIDSVENLRVSRTESAPGHDDVGQFCLSLADGWNPDEPECDQVQKLGGTP